MTRRIPGLRLSALAACLWCQSHVLVRAQAGRNEPQVSRSQTEAAVAESAIRQRVVDWAKAVGAKEIDSVMAFYAPDIVSFDLDPPLRYAGTGNKREAWQKLFAAYAGPIGYEVRELQVTTQGDLAFAHSLNHVSGKLANGRVTDMWVRWTACLQRHDDAWLIVHDHVSVPADLAHGRPAVDLTP